MSEAAKSRPSQQKRVLIVRVGAMGDVLHGLPAVTALRLLHPDWRIDWAIEPKWWELLVSRKGAPEKDQPDAVGPGPVVDQAIAVRSREWKQRGVSPWTSPRTLQDMLALRQQLRSAEYDLCIDLQGSLRSAVIGWLAGARKLVGPAQPREAPARHFYTQQVSLSSVHVVDQACDLIGAALGERLHPARVEPPIDWVAEAWRENLEHRKLRPEYPWRFLDGRAHFAVLAPTAGWGAKEWPVERFGEVARRLAATGLFVLVNAETWRSNKPEAVEREGGPRVFAVESTIAELTALLRRASLFIGGDTGPMHLADALGVPVVALFGPTDPARTGPRGPKSRVLRDPSSVTDHRRHSEAEAGLTRITVDEVMRAASELLNDLLHGAEGAPE